MKRTTASGNQTNLYTEGNPSLSIPATVVGADEMNNIQEELCNAIEHVGLTLSAADHFQLKQAIQLYVSTGGASQINQTINNNQVSAANVVGLLFTGYKAGRFQFDILRRTDSSHTCETGVGYLTRDTETSTWKLTVQTFFDDCDVDLTVDSTGQVQYTSSNMAGTSYSCVMRVSGIYKISN